MTATDAVISIDGLRFGWPGEPSLCLDIERFDVAAGERLFLYGPSGSGKSTLLNLIGGVLAPPSGAVRLLGHSLERLSSARRDRLRVDHVGFIFQQFNLIPYLSVIDNVLLPCRFSRKRRAAALADGGDLRSAAGRLLGHLDLAAGLWRKSATALSVGQQQRVAAARALIGRPEVVVADEPTSALDAERQGAFIDLLMGECARAGTTLVFVSHDRRLAGHFTRTVALPEINRACVT